MTKSKKVRAVATMPWWNKMFTKYAHYPNITVLEMFKSEGLI